MAQLRGGADEWCCRMTWQWVAPAGFDLGTIRRGCSEGPEGLGEPASAEQLIERMQTEGICVLVHAHYVDKRPESHLRASQR